jgi:hypothetical protein
MIERKTFGWLFIVVVLLQGLVLGGMVVYGSLPIWFGREIRLAGTFQEHHYRLSRSSESNLQMLGDVGSLSIGIVMDVPHEAAFLDLPRESDVYFRLALVDTALGQWDIREIASHRIMPENDQEVVIRGTRDYMAFVLDLGQAYEGVNVDAFPAGTFSGGGAIDVIVLVKVGPLGRCVMTGLEINGTIVRF